MYRHYQCSLRKISQTGEVESALPNLDSLLLAFVLIFSVESLPLGLSRLGAHLSKVTRAPTLETAVVVVRVSCLLSFRPWAGMLLLWWYKPRLLLLLLLLLRRSNNPMPLLRGLLRKCSWGILHNTIPRCWSTRGSSRCLPLLVSTMSQYEVLLGDSQIHQINI